MDAECLWGRKIFSKCYADLKVYTEHLPEVFQNVSQLHSLFTVKLYVQN